MCVGTGDCWVAVGLAASRAAGHRETHFSTQKYSVLLFRPPHSTSAARMVCAGEDEAEQ